MDSTTLQPPVPPPPIGQVETTGLDESMGFEENPSFFERIKRYFSDHRRAVLIGLAVIFIALVTTAILAIRSGSDIVSDPKGNNGNGGTLPIASNKEVDFIPKITKTGPGTVVLTWDLKEDTDGRVSYGLTEDYGFYADDQKTLTPATYAKHHSVIIRGLDESQTYHFLASSADRTGHTYYSPDLVLRPTTDTNPPTVSLNLQNGQRLSGKTNIKFTASDDQRVCSARLILDGRLIETEQNSNQFGQGFDLDTTPLANGNHDISVVVDDCVNTNRADVQVNIDNSTDGGTVNGGDDFVDEFGCTNFTTNLSARLISPADSANLSGQANLTVEARATGGQSISRVIYLVDLDLAAESSTAPYNSSLNTTYYTDGAHIITAIAMGENGNCSDYTDENSRSNVLFSNYLGSDDNARPYITNVSIEPTRDTLRIAWQTTMVTNALVEYGTTLSLGARVDSSQQDNDHEITLTGLQSNQLYYLKLSGRTTTGVAAEDYYTSASTNTNINVGDNHGCDQAAVNAYYACYYNNSDLTDMRFAQNENGINYSWSAGQSPDSRISPDTFSIIWQGQFFFDGGEYEFEATVDDGVRIYIDGNRIIDEWRNQNASTFRSISDISRGDHIVTMEYFQDTGTGEANLNWIYLGQNGDNPDSPTTPTSTCDVATNPNCDPNGEYNLMTINDINAFPTDISVDFSFRVSESANSTIYYGTSRSNLVSTINIGFSTDPDAVYRREARGLQPDTTYYYRIESTSNANAQRQAESPILSFTTHYAPNRQDMTASVSWDSTCEGVGRVYFDRFPHTSLAAYASSPYGGVVTAGRSGNRYTAVIVGLSSGVTYHYRHEIEGCAGSITPALNQADKTFTTPVN